MKRLTVLDLPPGTSIDFEGRNFEEYEFQELPVNTVSKSSTGFVVNGFGSWWEPLSGGLKYVRLRTQVKAADNNHVKALVNEQVERILHSEARAVGKDERKAITEEMTDKVLKSTYPKDPSNIDFIFDGDKVFVTTGSNSIPEYMGLFSTVLDEVLPSSLNVDDASDVFKRFLTEEVPEPFVLGNSVKVVESDGRTNTISKGDIETSVAPTLAKEGARVSSVSFDFDGVLDFKVDSNLNFTGLKFTGSNLSEVENDDNATLILQVNTVRQMYYKLIEAVNSDR